MEWTAKQISDKLSEIFASFTFVQATCTKTVQERQFEPYTLSFSQSMIVPVEDKDEAYDVMVDELDKKILDTFTRLEIEPMNKPAH